jgi:hypothetical protein
MKRKASLLAMGSLVLLLSAVLLLAQSAPQVKPNAENQKLAAWYGVWTYEGTSQTTVLGPGCKFTGRLTSRPVQNGFACEFIYDEKGPAGENHNLEIDFWDPARKAYAYIYLSDDGYVERGSFTIKGNIATVESTGSFQGKAFKLRSVDTFETDGQSFTRKAELCVDGKIWTPYDEAKFTKAKPAAK